MARERRTKKEVLEDKICKIEQKITELCQQMEKQQALKEKLKKELSLLLAAEKKAAEETELREITKLLKKKNVAMSRLRVMLEELEESGESIDK